MKKLLVIATLPICSAVCPQTIQQSPDRVILGLSATQVDDYMQQTAATVAKSAPIQSDEATTVVGAVYIKPSRTLLYRINLSSSISPAQAAVSMKPAFCSGRTNLAFMSKGVTYQYAVTTPTESYNLVFRRPDCP